MADVSVSIVSFNTCGLLEACLRSITASLGVSAEVWVVDNASIDGSPDMVEREFPAVHLIRLPRNSGFAAANNLVIRQVSGRYVLLLNPDTEVPPDALCRMVDFMDRQPGAGICGPRLLYADGAFQSCGLPFPTLWSEIRQSRSVARLAGMWTERPPVERRAGAPLEVDWVSGACLMIRRETIGDVGSMDEQFFLYAEELDWCFSAHLAGWQTYALPEIAVTHHEAQSTKQVAETALMHLIDTRLRFYSKHRGLPYAVIVSLVYAAGCVRRMREDGPKSRVKLRGVRSWWRDSLRALNPLSARRHE